LESNIAQQSTFRLQAGEGRGGICAATIRRHYVGARQDRRHLRCFQTGGERIGGIGPGVHNSLGINADQSAIRFGVDGDIVVVLTTIGIAGELLAPILDPAHRMAKLPREPAGAHLFR
jgi:hypothetical protein